MSLSDPRVRRVQNRANPRPRTGSAAPLDIAAVAILRDRAAEVAVGDVADRPAQVRVIDEVEHLHPERSFCVPPSAKFLKIARSHCWSPGFARCRGRVSNCQRPVGKGQRVEDKLSSSRTGRLAIRVGVDTPARSTGSRCYLADTSDVIGPGDRERCAGTEEAGTGELPAAEQVLHQRRRLAPERQIVDVSTAQHVSPVEARRAPEIGVVVGVPQHVPRGAGVVLGLAERIGQPTLKPLL